MFNRTKFCSSGQASTEYLVVFALVFVVLVPMMYYFQAYSEEAKDQIVAGQVRVIGTDVVSAAETVYYMGEHARLTVRATMPEGVEDIYVIDSWSSGANEIVFNLSDGSELGFPSSVNINGSFNETQWSPGLKKILLRVENTSDERYVQIEIT
jgi:uncharacterized protein (UPF0333 family)